MHLRIHRYAISFDRNFQWQMVRSCVDLSMHFIVYTLLAQWFWIKVCSSRSLKISRFYSTYLVKQFLHYSLIKKEGSVEYMRMSYLHRYTSLCNPNMGMSSAPLRFYRSKDLLTEKLACEKRGTEIELLRFVWPSNLVNTSHRPLLLCCRSRCTRLCRVKRVCIRRYLRKTVIVIFINTKAN